MKKYSYLRKYINNNAMPPRNRFSPINENKIKKSENRLGFIFPLQLKEFWQEIGKGALYISYKGEAGWLNNYILCPEEIANIMLLDEDKAVHCILSHIEECIDEGYIDITKGEIIFFEIADSSSFLVMKPNSDKPNAVYDMIGNVVEESFERFIWRLYYESPTFYLNAE